MLYNRLPGTRFTNKHFITVFSETYQPEKTIGNEVFQNTDYISQPLVMLTSFLGLPNNKRLSDKLRPRDVLNNMIDRNIEDEKKGKFSALDKTLALPMFFYYLIRSFFKVIINIAKIFTEFLPGLAEEHCRLAMERNKKANFGALTATFGFGLFSILHFIGRAITSPVKGWLAHGKGKYYMGMLSLAITGVSWGVIGLLALVPGIIALAFTSAVFILSAFAALISTLVSPLKAMYVPDGFAKTLIKKMGPPEKILDPALGQKNAHGNSTTTVFSAIPPNTAPRSTYAYDPSQELELPAAELAGIAANMPVNDNTLSASLPAERQSMPLKP